MTGNFASGFFLYNNIPTVNEVLLRRNEYQGADAVFKSVIASKNEVDATWFCLRKINIFCIWKNNQSFGLWVVKKVESLDICQRNFVKLLTKNNICVRMHSRHEFNLKI